MTTSPNPSASSPATPSSEADYLGMPPPGLRRRLFHIIFESDTPAGRAFDLVLLIAIVVSVAVVLLDSVASVAARHGRLLGALEWMFTLLFTAEYLARLACVQKPLRYATSFFGVVDLLAVAPTYLAWLFPELHAFIDIRLLRLLRIFRILKITAYVAEYGALGAALYASRRRIVVFIGTVFILVVLMGTLMYVIEGPQNGFTSIPVAVYWAISTMSTVGYGDLVPKTGWGRFIASFMMLLGWGTLAVPTGIVTAELTARRMGRGRQEDVGRSCAACGELVHLEEAHYCHSCGAALAPAP
jgi:voltage-gated potassium channel